MIPPKDFDLVYEWAQTLNPERRADGYHFSVGEHGSRYVTITEVHPAQLDASRPVARLRYTSTTGMWELLYADRNGRYHVYEMTVPTRDLTKLLDAVAADPLHLFFP